MPDQRSSPDSTNTTRTAKAMKGIEKNKQCTQAQLEIDVERDSFLQ